MTIPKTIHELDDLRSPIKGYTFFGDKKGNLVVIQHTNKK